MRGLALYARSRRLFWVTATLIVAGGAASAMGAVYVGMDEFGDMALLPTVILGPVPAVVLVMLTIGEPSAEIAVAGWRRLHLWRLSHVACLVVIPVVAYLPLASHADMTWGYEAAVRNLFGYLGIGLVVGAVGGANWAWAGPMVYGLGGFLLEAQMRSGSLLYWPARPDGDTAALIVAAGLAFTGAAAIWCRRSVGLADDAGAQ